MARTKLKSLELRDQVYKLYISKDAVDYVTTWAVLLRHACLLLVQTCKQIYQEFISLAKSSKTFRIRHYHLACYLNNFHPLAANGVRTYGAAKLYALQLPNRD